jgi:hypothetical protein
MAAVWSRSALQNHPQEVAIFIGLRYNAPAKGSLPTRSLWELRPHLVEPSWLDHAQSTGLLRHETRSLSREIWAVLIPKQSRFVMRWKSSQK